MLAGRLRRLNQSAELHDEVAELVAEVANDASQTVDALVALWQLLLPWDRTPELADGIDGAATVEKRELVWHAGKTPKREDHAAMRGCWYELGPSPGDGEHWSWWAGPDRVWRPGPPVAEVMLRWPLAPKPE